LQGQAAAELDDVVGDNGNADPALHPFEPSIPAAIQSVAPIQHANAAFASGPPALPGPETNAFSTIQISTPEEVRKIHDEGVRIMSITMPYALKQIQAMYQRTPDRTHARFVHYTTAEAALSIIRTKRLWLRNTNCMSDYREVQHGFDIYNRYFLDAAKLKAFVDAFDTCTPGAADEAFSAFNNCDFLIPWSHCQAARFQFG